MGTKEHQGVPTVKVVTLYHKIFFWTAFSDNFFELESNSVPSSKIFPRYLPTYYPVAIPISRKQIGILFPIPLKKGRCRGREFLRLKRKEIIIRLPER
ncbi:MAG: hypothetical protein K9K37_06580 [Desulfocapsa sp.]|nr:hypothetical protein [Desulfocapsa sp.]